MAATGAGIVVGRPSVPGPGRPRPHRRRRTCEPRPAGAARLQLLGARHGTGVRPDRPSRGAKCLRAGRGGRGAAARTSRARAVRGTGRGRRAAAVHAGRARRRRRRRCAIRTFPEVPHFAELFATRTGNKPRGPLYDAWCAAAAAAQLEFGLVLPQLTPAAMVSLWRRAGTDAMAVQGVQTAAATAQRATARRARRQPPPPPPSPPTRRRCSSCGAGWPAGSTGIPT